MSKLKLKSKSKKWKFTKYIPESNDYEAALDCFKAYSTLCSNTKIELHDIDIFMAGFYRGCAYKQDILKKEID